jgi:hypothetical protein
MKQTAIQQLIHCFENDKMQSTYPKEQIINLLNFMLEKEKQQIVEAHIDGFYSPPFGKSRNGEAKDYYDKTFKSE